LKDQSHSSGAGAGIVSQRQFSHDTQPGGVDGGRDSDKFSRGSEREMEQVRIGLPQSADQIDPGLRQDLQDDLEREVGATAFAETGSAAGAKSGTAVDWATLTVSLLGTPAVVALVSVIKSYFDRQRVTEMTLETGHGKITLKLPTGSHLSAEDIRRALDGVLALK
jgi:hypothetical protein